MMTKNLQDPDSDEALTKKHPWFKTRRLELVRAAAWLSFSFVICLAQLLLIRQQPGSASSHSSSAWLSFFSFVSSLAQLLLIRQQPGSAFSHLSSAWLSFFSFVSSPAQLLLICHLPGSASSHSAFAVALLLPLIVLLPLPVQYLCFKLNMCVWLAICVCD